MSCLLTVTTSQTQTRSYTQMIHARRPAPLSGVAPVCFSSTEGCPLSRIYGSSTPADLKNLAVTRFLTCDFRDNFVECAKKQWSSIHRVLLDDSQNALQANYFRTSAIPTGPRDFSSTLALIEKLFEETFPSGTLKDLCVADLASLAVSQVFDRNAREVPAIPASLEYLMLYSVNDKQQIRNANINEGLILKYQHVNDGLILKSVDFQVLDTWIVAPHVVPQSVGKYLLVPKMFFDVHFLQYVAECPVPVNFCAAMFPHYMKCLLSTAPCQLCLVKRLVSSGWTKAAVLPHDTRDMFCRCNLPTSGELVFQPQTCWRMSFEHASGCYTC